MKGYNVEHDITDERGYRQVVIRMDRPYARHRCGYVGIPAGHPLHGKDYDAPSKFKLGEMQTQESNPVGTYFALCALSEGDEFAIISYAANVNGGITYADGSPTYPVDNDGLWWFGYDCAHIDDVDDGGKPLSFCIDECEKLAAFLEKAGA